MQSVMETQRDILLVSTPVAATPPDAVRMLPTAELAESPSIVPSDPVKTESAPDPALKPEQARARLEAFREFATGCRRRELAAKASASSQDKLKNNVQQLSAALNRVEAALPDSKWSIEKAIELARKSSKRPSELDRVSKLLDEFNRVKPVMTRAKQFGTRVSEILAVLDLKPSQASARTHLAVSTVYKWMSGKVLPAATKANRNAAAALEDLAERPGYLRPLLRPAWGNVERPAHISAKKWRPILERLRRGGHCDLEGAELSQKIDEFLETPNKTQREPYRFPQKLSRWPAVPRAEIEAYKALTQLRSEPKWAANQ